MKNQKLLSDMDTNAKTIKSVKDGQFIGRILYLAPADLSGVNLCPAASAGCKKVCLFTAGRGAFQNVKDARFKKTEFYNTDRNGFLKQLVSELNALCKKAKKQNKKPIVRLNGTSDIDWENLIITGSEWNIFRMFPEIQFYDYTKRLDRLGKLSRKPIANYSLTFSASEVNERACKRALELGFNVAVVFRKELPPEFWSKPVFNGDETDLRFLDPKGYVIGLKAKGQARKDNSGFVKEIA